MADLNLKFENGKAPALNATNMNAIVDAINDRMPKTGIWTDDWVLNKNKIRLGNADEPRNIIMENDNNNNRIKVYDNNEDDSIRTETEIVEGDVRIHNNNPSKGSKYTYSLLDVGENTNKNAAEITNIKTDLSKLGLTVVNGKLCVIYESEV